MINTKTTRTNGISDQNLNVHPWIMNYEFPELFNIIHEAYGHTILQLQNKIKSIFVLIFYQEEKPTRL